MQELTKRDRLYIRFWKDRGTITQFVVQYEIHIEGRWIPAMRFDNSHGSMPHKHTFYLRGDEQKVELEEEAGLVLTQAKHFLEMNYLMIRENFRNN